ncbi:MAG: hypothetical protein RL272_710 [Candidatus Parcubacteria bacterium]|jgi:hypothetical protein
MRNARGFATITTTIILGIAFAFVVILLDATLAGRKAGKAHQEELTAARIAEAGMDKAIYCFNAASGANCGGTYGTNYAGESNVSFGGGAFTTTLAGSGTTRTVTSVGSTASGSLTTIVADITSVPPTDTLGFSYALQSGSGGAKMDNNSTISGTIYSSGDITCQSTSATITGDAYSSKAGGKIDKCRVDYMAHADKILNSSVGQNAYYNTNPTDIAGTTVSGTKFANQATPADAPLSPFNLDFWHDSAEAGGIISGNYSPANGSTLGPVKIEGDLTMANNVVITVAGPVWVVGDITTGNNVTFNLDPAFGEYSTVILADDPANQATKGKITISNNTAINGSGNSKSHILFASTNTSTADNAPALDVSNNAAGAVFYALNGTMRLSNNGGAKSLSAYRLYLTNNSSVTYVASDFTGQFSNSPGGSWHVVEGTWRQTH